MGNCFSTHSEPDVESEKVTNLSESLQLDNDNERLPHADSPTIELDPTSALTSTKQASQQTVARYSKQQSEEIIFDSAPTRLKEESKSPPNPPSTIIPSNMSNQFKSFKQGSDKNCVKSCGLQYGISDVFDQIVLEQQKVKASKSQIKPQTFDDPNDQKYYDHMLEDVMVKTFTNDDEQKIFRKSLEGMKTNYPEILEGQEKNMFFCPTAFNFSSRIAEDETCVPDALDEMKLSLEAKQKLTPRDERNLQKIRAHLQKLRPEMAEQEFVDALACFFYSQRGIFIHSLKLDDHLKVLTNKAREYRRQNKRIGFGFTGFEKKLAEQLNISTRTLIDTADTVVNHLLTNPKASNKTKINGKVVRDTIDKQLTRANFVNVKTIFNPNIPSQTIQLIAVTPKTFNLNFIKSDL